LRNGTEKKNPRNREKNEIIKKQRREIEEKRGGEEYLGKKREIVAICTKRVDLREASWV
jgi:hypothetical protein